MEGKASLSATCTVSPDLAPVAASTTWQGVRAQVLDLRAQVDEEHVWLTKGVTAQIMKQTGQQMGPARPGKCRNTALQSAHF